MIIKKIECWETSDGVKHHTHEMAVQYVLNAEVLEIFTRHNHLDAQDIVNLISSNIRKFREYLDACDASEKASLR